MIATGLPCLECGHEIVRANKRIYDRNDKLMFCGNSCRGTWTNRGRDRSRVGPVGAQVIALAFNHGEVTAPMLAAWLGTSRVHAKSTLQRLWSRGRLVRVGHGVYALPRVIEAQP